MKVPKILLILLAIIGGCLLIGGCAVWAGNHHVKRTTKSRILSPEEAAKLTDVDCILVLGCGVREDGTPSNMLEDRLRRSVELYHANAAPKILMSGDHGREGYNEVGTMKQYAIDAGVPSSDIFMDHAGFSTYESLYRTKEIFGAKKIIIISQDYHLNRSLYIAKEMGIDAYAVAANYRAYNGQFNRDVREVLARCKDMLTTAFKVPPTFGGEPIPISGNGDVTNDE